MRDFRAKESSQGIASTAEESQTSLTKAVDFLRKQEEQPAAKRRRTTKTATQIPRLATLDWLRSMDRALEFNTGKNFKSFNSKEYLQDSSVSADGMVMFPPTSGLAPGLAPPVLIITSDQQSTQTCGLSYLKHRLGLCVEHIPDPYHMMWNATKEAVVNSSMAGSLQAAIAVCNVAYGPWQRSSFARDIQGAADELAADADSENPLLLFWWDRIEKDQRHGITDESKTAREIFLRELTNSPAGGIKGPKASSSRFFSVMDALAFWDEHWHTKAWILTYISMKKGWAKHIDDILFPDREATAQLALQAIADATEGDVP